MDNKEEKNAKNISSNENLRQSLLNKQEKKYKSDTYKSIIIILALIIFIGGIVLGNTYQTTTLKDSYKNTTLPVKDYMYETNFNMQLMLNVWASGFVFTLFMLLLCDILKTQEEIKEHFIN